MSLRLLRDVAGPGDEERCCFCRKPTLTWVDGNPRQSVACCEPCATRATYEDLPTKAQWMRRERIATGDRR